MTALIDAGAGVRRARERRAGREDAARKLVAMLDDGGAGAGESAAGVLLRRILDAAAEYERALIRSRTRAALRAKRARGERAGLHAPLGYRVAADGVRLEPEPREQELLSVVRELRDAGASQRAIGAELHARGFRSRAGSPLLPVQVARLLRAACPSSDDHGSRPPTSSDQTARSRKEQAMTVLEAINLDQLRESLTRDQEGRVVLDDAAAFAIALLVRSRPTEPNAIWALRDLGVDEAAHAVMVSAGLTDITADRPTPAARYGATIVWAEWAAAEADAAERARLAAQDERSR
jgi:hypothetical protein